MKRQTYSKTQLISLLQEWVLKHGEVPSRQQVIEDASMPSDMPFRWHFGNWGNAVRAAGFEPKKPTISPQCRVATIAAHKDKRSYNWKGGRIKDRYGYIQVWKPEHPNAKFGKGYIHEHRLVISEILGRPLETTEYVHHKNAIKDDNRPENLEIMTKKVHRGEVECPYCQHNFTIR